MPFTTLFGLLIEQERAIYIAYRTYDVSFITKHKILPLLLFTTPLKHTLPQFTIPFSH